MARTKLGPMQQELLEWAKKYGWAFQVWQAAAGLNWSYRQAESAISRLEKRGLLVCRNAQRTRGLPNLWTLNLEVTK